MEGAPHDAHQAWEREEAARAAFGWFEPAPVARAHERQPAERRSAEARPLSGDIAIDTNGELVPRYEFVNQPAGQLVSGDFMVEPYLGPVRITWVAPIGEAPREEDTLVQVRWLDGTRRQSAALALPPERPVLLRVPDREDGLLIQRAIDRAHYFGTSLSHRGARLIAAHLQLGTTTSLYSLALRGEILPSAFEELAVMAESRRPYISRWSRTLYAYCQQRADRGPLSAAGRPRS
jgi:hypothetical protein